MHALELLSFSNVSYSFKTLMHLNEKLVLQILNLPTVNRIALKTRDKINSGSKDLMSLLRLILSKFLIPRKQ